MSISRRNFVQALALSGVALRSGSRLLAQAESSQPLFTISLAQWSLHRTIFGSSQDDHQTFTELLRTDPDRVLQGTLSPLDFAMTARQEFDIDAIEYVNVFFFGHARDTAYLRELQQRSNDAGVKNLLIMCDFEGRLGDPSSTERTKAVENHHKWIEAAAFLGCHSIRVNAGSAGSWSEQAKLAADGLTTLADYADTHDIDVIVENHGGLSSNGQWLRSVMELGNHRRLGPLPAFGNFNLGDGEVYDNYQGVAELMPYAKAVSAKSYNFDSDGNEAELDYERMMRIVLDAGYRGWVGIEYEGGQLEELTGIRATKSLLERMRDKLASEY